MKNNLSFMNGKVKGFVILLTVILFVFSACKKDRPVDKETKYREIAWNYLDDQSKATVRVDWKIAPVTYLTQDNQELAAVMLGTKDDALLGPIIVYISVKTKVVQGIGPRF